MREVLEASRGARLVVNDRNENLFLNSKFRAICKSVGTPSYQCLLDIVGDKKKEVEDIAALARAGQIGRVEIESVQLGQRRWFNIVRDTTTHEIKAVYLMTEAPPAASSAPALGMEV